MPTVGISGGRASGAILAAKDEANARRCSSERQLVKSGEFKAAMAALASSMLTSDVPMMRCMWTTCDPAISRKLASVNIDRDELMNEHMDRNWASIALNELSDAGGRSALAISTGAGKMAAKKHDQDEEERAARVGRRASAFRLTPSPPTPTVNDCAGT